MSTMAAALAASLPAAPSPTPAAAPAANASTLRAAKDSIPADLKSGLDVEGLIPITEVELDGMVRGSLTL
jgi:hypothetical protein